MLELLEDIARSVRRAAWFRCDARRALAVERATTCRALRWQADEAEKQGGQAMTPAAAAKLPRGDRAALCRILEQKGGSDLYTADDCRRALAIVVG